MSDDREKMNIRVTWFKTFNDIFLKESQIESNLNMRYQHWNSSQQTRSELRRVEKFTFTLLQVENNFFSLPLDLR